LWHTILFDTVLTPHHLAPSGIDVRVRVRVRIRGGYVPTTVTRLVRCDKRV